MTLVDTNVVLDLATTDNRWFAWSRHHLHAALLRGAACINDIVYAELSLRYQRIEALERALSSIGVDRHPISSEALFLAGKVFARYRQNGGTRQNLLPDFFIGAQAEVQGFALLTRDPRRYRTYFPDVVLIAPAS